MIATADEFRRLRLSDDLGEQRRASTESAAEGVWSDVIRRFPDLRPWVAHNKTVPLSILRELAGDASVEVRWRVATKRKLDKELFELLARDNDPGVRHRIACNAKTPRGVLAGLANDLDAFVAREASERLAQRGSL